MKIRFSDFELDAQRYVLARAGKPLSIRPKVFDLLVQLARHRERVVRREELVQALWGTTQVGAGSLSGLVNELRAILGEDGRSLSSIRTVHARGYQFVAPVWGEEAAPSRTAGDPLNLIERVAAGGSLGLIVAAEETRPEFQFTRGEGDHEGESDGVALILAASKDSGFLVVHVRAPDEARELPTRFVHDLIEVLVRLRGVAAVGRALPLPARAWFASGRGTAVAGGVAPTSSGMPGGFGAVAEMLDPLARERPVAIFVEDFEEAGVPFARDLANMMKRLEEAPVLCVVSTKSPSEGGGPLRVLESQAGFERWQGPERSAHPIEERTQHTGLAALPPQLADALVAHADGDIERVLQWVEGIREQGGLSRQPLRVSPAPTKVSSTGKVGC